MTTIQSLNDRMRSLIVGGVFLLLIFSQAAWSAISLVGVVAPSPASGSSNSLTLTLPTGLDVDDVMIAQIAVRGNRTITAPAGWVLIRRNNSGNGITQAVYWRRSTASNPVSSTWGFNASDRNAGAIAAYRGVDPLTPVNVSSGRANGSSSNITANSVRPTQSGTQLVGLFALADGRPTFTPPPSMTEHVDISSGAGPNGAAIELADEAYTGGTAATGTRVATVPSNRAARSVAHLLALRPYELTSYRMDEATWSTATGQVLDSSGRAYHATAVNGPVSASATAAIPGSPGTCNYGSFDGVNDYVALPNAFLNRTTDFTITAWIRTTNNAKTGQRILIDDQRNTGGYGLSLGDGGTGRLRFYARSTSPVSLDTPNVIQNNTWYFVAAVTNIVAKTKNLYVYDQAGTQLAFVTQSFTGTWGTDTGAASIGGENNASSESFARFSGNLDEVNVFSGVLSTTKLVAVMNQTRSCVTPPTATPSAFNAFESATLTGSVAGVIKTKVAASAFGLDVVAIRTGGAAVETAFTGSVRLELVDASSGASCGTYALVRSLGSLTYVAADQGRKLLAGINESNAWPNARIRMSYPATGTPTVVSCSTDNFAIRPDSLAGIIVSDTDSSTSGALRTLYNTGVSGGNVHKAGRPFQMTATARNASGATTSNYSGSPAATLTACVLPSVGCTLGTLTPGAWATTAGTVVAAAASYSEVGAFSMKLVDTNFAAVDAADGSTAAERNIESIAFNVGRFVPDRFVLATASTPEFITFNDAACATRSFTYMGQPFAYSTPPQATITAQNVAGGTTLNYSGALWKLVSTDALQTYTAANPLDTGLIGAAVVTSTGGGTGTLSADPADRLAFLRAAPIAQFAAAINLTMSVSDTSENTVSGNGTITATPVLFSNIAFDSGNEIRFGRLALANAHGSELLGLPIPIETQFWNGAGFTRNTVDHCTQLIQDNVALSNWQRNLSACRTSVTLAGRFIGGRGNLRLSAPGATFTGSVDLTLNLGAVGTGNTCVGGVVTAVAGADQTWLQVGAAFNENPVARGSFGLFRGSKPLIYMRELY